MRKGNDTMRVSSSVHKTSSGDALSEQQERVLMRPVTLSERSLLLLALIRIFVGLLWFQQLFWKLPPDFTGLHRYVVEEGKYTFLPGYAFIIQHVLLPNFLLLGAFTWTAEFVVTLSLLFGLFTRFGAILATILALQLYIGLAYAPGEWYWTYGMLILLGLVLAAVPAGRRLGLDQWLVLRLERDTSQIARFFRWFM